MAIDLGSSLSWKKANPEEVLMLQALQGNILKGHGRESTANIFFRLDPAKTLASSRMLRDLGNFHVTNAYRQLLDVQQFKATGKGGGPFVHVALTSSGYAALGKAAAAPADPDFAAGMKSAGSIAALDDPPVGDWEDGFQEVIHGIVIAADATVAMTAALSGTIRELIEDAGGEVVLVQHGLAVKNAAGEGIENFGYVDGRSQPLMLKEDIEAEAKAAGSVRWDPEFPLSAALVKDPGTTDDFSFGSFFVFRKLEQAVRKFKRREQQIANVLGLKGDDRELAGAMIVGRFEDGTPVTLSKTARGAKPPNDFDYSTDSGSRCPAHAHIRKSNPRGSGGAEPEPDERAHIMPRRGITYEDVKRKVHPDELPEAETLSEFDAKVAPLLPQGGVGLLFMAYNQNIGQQFKFTQQIWVNNPGFPFNPPGPHGIDPVIGQGPNPAGAQKLPVEWDDPAQGTKSNVDFAGFVKMKGGEYFFSPSLTFLRSL